MSSEIEGKKGHEEVKLQKSGEVGKLLESRHILDEEIKMVIHNAETKGEKLYKSEMNRYLARMRIMNATFYVEYSISDEGVYIIHTAYSHRSEMEE